MNINSSSLNTFRRRGTYRNSVLLLLLLRKEPINIPEFRAGMKFITGWSSVASMVGALNRLGGEGIVLKHRKDIIPKRVSKARKPHKYTIFKKADRVFEVETQAGDNNRWGRYHSFYHVNPGLPVGFVSKLKHETAGFFGFRSWFDMLKPRPEDTLLNIRNAWKHFYAISPKRATKVPRSLGIFIEDKTAVLSDGSEAVPGCVPTPAGVSPVRTPESVMKQTVSIPQLLQLDRRTKRLLERYGIVLRNIKNTWKGVQRDNLLSGSGGLGPRKGSESEAPKFS